MKYSQYAPFVAGIVLALSATSIISLQANAVSYSSGSSAMSESSTSIDSSMSSDSSSCGADKCQVTTKEPNATTKKCDDGYTEYTYSLDGGNQKQMCAKCDGTDKCPTGETCTLEKYTQEVGSHTIKHMKCTCKADATSSSEFSISSESSSSLDFSSSSL